MYKELCRSLLCEEEQLLFFRFGSFLHHRLKLLRQPPEFFLLD